MRRDLPGRGDPAVSVHPIEAESYRILAERVDLSPFGPLGRAVVARVIHACADLDYAQTMVVDEAAVRAGVDALRRGGPVLADVEMVRGGIRGVSVECGLAAADDGAQPTRSAAGIRAAARRHPEGAVVVIGCAPTALDEALRLHATEGFAPALIVGLPVGFVGAAEAKARLRASVVPSISNVGDKGGSAVAAAAVNAMVRLATGG
jgi:precorrin-8X/cobalt-precorrin-8 methylmutase